MIIAVADTHAAIWYLSYDPRMSRIAREFMENTARAGHQIGISGITLVEMIYLVEKGRIYPQQFSQLAIELESPDSIFVEVPVDLNTARSLSRVDVAQIPDMPDRIITATALQLSVPIISRDGRIKASTVQTIW